MPVGRLAHTFTTFGGRRNLHKQLLAGWDNHLTHHLFPLASSPLFGAQSRIIAQIASQQGLDYQLLTLAVC